MFSKKEDQLRSFFTYYGDLIENIRRCFMCTKENRWAYIDLLECIAIFFVVMYHTSTFNYDIVNNSNILVYIRYFIRGIFSICVPLFFFVNGYLLFNKELKLRKHNIKIIRIIIITVIWGNISNMILAQYNADGHLWYMETLLFIYVFFPLLKNTYDNNRKWFICFTIIVAILTFGNRVIYHAMNIYDTISNNNSIININIFSKFNQLYEIKGYAFVYFCVGGLSHEIKNKLDKIQVIKRNVLAVVTIIVSSALLFRLGVFYSESKGVLWEIVFSSYDTIFTFINTCAIFVLCMPYKKEIPLIKIISDNTLGIYLMNNIVIKFTKPYIEQIPLLCTLLGTCLYVTLIILICLGIILIMKKIPVIKELIKI